MSTQMSTAEKNERTSFERDEEDDRAAGNFIRKFCIYPNPQEVRYLECVLQHVNRNWRLVVNYRVGMELLQLKALSFEILRQDAKGDKWNTWNRAKWIRWRTNCGRPNQKYLSEPCTRGIPWITVCFSTISRAILVRIAWSFVPTAKIICSEWMMMDYRNLARELRGLRLQVRWGFHLTITGISDAQNNACHPEQETTKRIIHE